MVFLELFIFHKTMILYEPHAKKVFYDESNAILLCERHVEATANLAEFFKKLLWVRYISDRQNNSLFCSVYYKFYICVCAFTGDLRLLATQIYKIQNLS